VRDFSFCGRFCCIDTCWWRHLGLVPSPAFLGVLPLAPDTHFRHRKWSAESTHLPCAVTSRNARRRPECGLFEAYPAPASKRPVTSAFRFPSDPQHAARLGSMCQGSLTDFWPLRMPRVAVLRPEDARPSRCGSHELKRRQDARIACLARARRGCPSAWAKQIIHTLRAAREPGSAVADCCLSRARIGQSGCISPTRFLAVRADSGRGSERGLSTASAPAKCARMHAGIAASEAHRPTSVSA
jgi:hypothetical protein